MAVNSGKDFENQIRDSMPEEVFYYRLKDPAQSFGQDSSKTRFSLSNPYDFFMYSYPYAYTIENKSKQTNSLSWTLDIKTKGKDIKASQLIELFESYKKGLISGLLINFREVNETYFLHIRDFMDFAAKTNKSSISLSDVREFNGFLVPQRLKKVKYAYDINALIQHCESMYQEYHNKIKGVKLNDSN